MKNFNRKTFEAKLKNKLLHIIEEGKILASQFGGRNIPGLSDSMNSCFGELHYQMQGLIDESANEIGFQTISQEVKQNEQLAGKQTQDASHKLMDARTEQNNITSELKGMAKPVSRNKAKIILIAIAITCFADGLYNYQTFLSWGLDMIGAIVGALILALVLTLLAHNFQKIVALGKTVWQRRLIILSILAMLISFFAYLGYSRSKYLEAIAKSQGVDISISPVPFVLGSLLFIVVAIAAYAFMMPSKEELAYAKKYADACNEKKVVDQKVLKLENSINNIEGNHARLIIDGVSQYEIGHFYEQMIVNSANTCFRTFCRYNLMHRKDGITPTEFNGDYPFQFTLHFPNHKLLTHENN